VLEQQKASKSPGGTCLPLNSQQTSPKGTAFIHDPKDHVEEQQRPYS